MVSPECLASIMFCEVMSPTEAILIRGTERFTESAGYATTFSCVGPHVDMTPVDADGFRDNFLVAFDATFYRREMVITQYESCNQLRDLNKVSRSSNIII